MMEIAVIGAGAIGSVVAGLLTKTGENVLLVGRPAQVKAIRDKGLAINTSNGQETVPVRVAERLDRAYDLVIFTVKSQDLEQAYQDNMAYLEHGRVLTTQNGVQGDNLLSTHFEPGNMYSSIVMFGATYMQSGQVVLNFPGDWILGKPYTPLDNVIEDIAGILRKAFPVTVTPFILGMKWLKLFINFNNSIPACLNLSMQETFADLDFCRLSILLLNEGLQVVRSAGIEMVSLPSFPVERILGIAGMPIETAAGIMQKTLTGLSREPLYGSILQSIKRGKPSEIDFINGEVDLLAASLRMNAPLNRKIVALVHRVENTGVFFSPAQLKAEFGL
jgi:2-dehydropantoate 2-reductase